MTMTEDKLILGGHEFTSRFILGSGKYNLKLIEAAIEQGGALQKNQPFSKFFFKTADFFPENRGFSPRGYSSSEMFSPFISGRSAAA